MRKRKLKSSQTPKKPRLDLSGVIDAQTAFSCRLLKELTATSADSLVCSPFSVAACLAIVFAGAGGSTKDELRKQLGNDASDDQIHQYFSVLLAEMAKKSKHFNLESGSKLCVKDCGALQDDFQAIINENYRGSLELFNSNAATSLCQKLNAWVNELTARLIPSIIRESDVTPLTSLILLNAVYFKGVWVNQFKQSSSQDKPFKISPAKTKTVRMMHQRENFEYHETKHFKLIRFAYNGGKLAMYAFLPKKFREISALFDGFQESELLELMVELKNAEKVKVEVEFPCFEIECEHNLSAVLESIGLKDALSANKADFSRIFKCSDPLPIGAVVQKAYIKTNEKGTEAAAATRVQWATTSSRSVNLKSFKADHPFFYFIVQETKMCVLFAGTFT